MEPRIAVLDLALRELGVAAEDGHAVQKAVYIAQAAGAPLGYRFAWYARGPHSGALVGSVYLLGLATEGDASAESQTAQRLLEPVREQLGRVRPCLQVPDDVDLESGDWLELVSSVHYLQGIMDDGLDGARWKMREIKPQLAVHLDEAERELGRVGLDPWSHVGDDSDAFRRDGQPEARKSHVRETVEGGNRVYLAARYSRRVELLGLVSILARHGFEVTARWLRGDHELPGTDDQDPVTGEISMDARPYAIEDFEDVRRADTLVAFTEPPRSAATRGDRHVEMGLALAWEKRTMILGPRENVFCTLPQVEQYGSWEEVLEALNNPPGGNEAVLDESGEKQTPHRL